MDLHNFINNRIKDYYWKYDLSCATANLKTLAEYFKVELSEQVLDSTIGMHGAGGYRAQCGLVEGTLMLIGIIGKNIGTSNEDIIDCCYNFADKFENRFSSLSCKILRPGGFNKNDPPHLCEKLTCVAIIFNINHVAEFINKVNDL